MISVTTWKIFHITTLNQERLRPTCPRLFQLFMAATSFVHIASFHIGAGASEAGHSTIS